MLIGRLRRMKLGYIPSGWLRGNELKVIRKGAQAYLGHMPEV